MAAKAKFFSQFFTDRDFRFGVRWNWFQLVRIGSIILFIYVFFCVLIEIFFVVILLNWWVLHSIVEIFCCNFVGFLKTFRRLANHLCVLLWCVIFFFGNLVICWWKLMSILIDSYMFSYMLFEGPINLRKIFHLKTIRTFSLDVLLSFMKFFILYFAKLKGFKLSSYIIFILPNTYLYYVLLASWKNSSISLISDMNECWV